jgi:hypothetical protein
MSQDPETILCECFTCKGKNPELGGKFVSNTTFRRHRKKESNWSNIINVRNLNITPSDDLNFLNNNVSDLNIEER